MAPDTLSIANNGHTIFGYGCLSEISLQLHNLAIKRPLIVTDKGIMEAGLLAMLTAQLTSAPDYTLFSDTPANPNEAAVNMAAAAYKGGGCDGIIAFGGGSSLDLGKAAGLRVSHAGDLEDFTTQNNGALRISDTPPLIAIPTSAGTGSEVARAAVIILRSGEKRIIASPKLVPDIAILDPALTMSLSPYLTAATGMDAVSHCLEAILSPIFNPTADAIGLAGLAAAIGEGFLLAAVVDGTDKKAREVMLSVSTHGAMAFSKGLGAVHAMSHACGRNEVLRLHHGTLNAVLLPVVLRCNLIGAGEKYPRIAAAMGLGRDADLAAYFTTLNSQLGLPAGLSDMGITSAMIPELAAHAATDFCSATNPVFLDEAGYADLFTKALVS